MGGFVTCVARVGLLVLDAEVSDGPAISLADRANDVRQALHAAAKQIMDGYLPVFPPSAWLRELPPERRDLLAFVASQGVPDRLVAEFSRRRRELRALLRPYVLFRR